jgi:hypothetical protein
MKSRLAISYVAIVAVCFAIIGTLVVPGVRADEWNKQTVITFNEDVQVPGKVLPAGTYTFKLADSESDRNIVEIYNADGTHLITTILAISDNHTQVAAKTLVSFDERPSGQPEAIKAWFYPGDNYGVQFVYPKQKAAELAQANQQPVLSTSDELLDSVVMKEAAIESVEPAPEPSVVEASAPAVTTDNTDSNDQPGTDAVLPAELPQTASPMPSIALGGILLLAAAFGIRRFSAV